MILAPSSLLGWDVKETRRLKSMEQRKSICKRQSEIPIKTFQALQEVINVHCLPPTMSLTQRFPYVNTGRGKNWAQSQSTRTSCYTELLFFIMSSFWSFCSTLNNAAVILGEFTKTSQNASPSRIGRCCHKYFGRRGHRKDLETLNCKSWHVSTFTWY